MKSPGRPKEIEGATAVVGIVVPYQVKVVLRMIARREDKTISELLRPDVERYAKAHATGNEQFTLDKSIDQSEFVAMPTMGEILTPERLSRVGDDDLAEMQMAVKARGEEIAAAVRKRHITWREKQGKS